MTRRDIISDKYQEAVQRLISNPGSSLSSVQITPEELEEIWEDISSDLDIGDTWTRISSGLDAVLPTDHGPGFFLKGCAAALLILSMLTPVRRAIPVESHIETKTPIVTNLNDQSGDFHFNSGPAGLSSGKKSQGISLPATGALPVMPAFSNAASIESGGVVIRADLLSLAGEIAFVTGVPVVSAEGEKELFIPRDTALTAPRILQAELFQGNLERITVTPPDYIRPMHNGSNYSANPGLPSTPGWEGRFSGGMISSFRNTWLLNRETFDGLRAESLTTTVLVVFPDAGLSVNFTPGRRWSLQADAFLCSTTGQQYSGYIYGHYSQKKILLRYSTIAISAKYRTGREDYPANRSSINFLAGGYISFLQRAQQRINDDISEIRSEYRKFDIGIRLSGEFELLLNDQLSVAPGVSLSLGIPNIYKGDGIIPGYMRRTHNGSADFHLSFYYQFE